MINIPVRNLKITNMNADTVKAVEKLERLCFASPWSLDSLITELSNPLAVFLTAGVDGEIIGYAGMHHVVDEGYVTNVAVLPDYRGRGIARALVGELLEYGKRNGLCIITLEVRESNMAARNLYESLNFETVGRRRGFYTHPTEDAILMTYTLNAVKGEYRN